MILFHQQWWIQFSFWWSYFSFSGVFSGENCVRSSSILFIFESFSLNIYGKTTSWITSICLTVSWKEVNSLLHQQQYQNLATHTWWYFDDTCSNITFTCFSNKNSSFEHLFFSFSFSFSSGFLTYQSNFSVFWKLNLPSFHLVYEFLVTFWCCEYWLQRISHDLLNTTNM